jgi:FkbM family methyltransferase
MGILRRVKVLLASRKLFRNWFLAGIRYYLIKLGLIRSINIKVIYKDGSRAIIPWIAYGNLVNDYYDGYVTDYDYKKGIVTCVGKVHVPIEELEKGSAVGSAIKNGWVYDSVGGFWFRGGVRFKHAYWLILEVFDKDVYESLNVRDKVVVDVGAYIGDSAIYFALRGARRVIAVEPHPGAYAEMLENIRLNNLESVIIPVNAGLASKPSKVCVENVDTSSTFNIYHRPGDCPNAIPAVTLGELISRFSVDPNDTVTKMDCEGCEYDVILNDYEHVKLFKELILEYHSNVNKLLKVLSRDYKCMHGNGIMHCIRK